MAKYNDGELISLNWDGQPDAYYIKGWAYVNPMIDELLKEEIIQSREEISSFKKTYARWNASRDEMNDPVSVLQTKDGPGRGRFKVTEIELKQSKIGTL